MYYKETDESSFIDYKKSGYWYGTPRHSGRYPWGSGENPYQHQDDRSIYRKNKEFLEKFNQMKRDGVPEIDIAKHFGFKNTSELRARRSAATNTNKKLDMEQIAKYRARGYSTAEIARRTELPPGTVRSLENPKTQANARSSDEIINQLKHELETKKYLNVGIGTHAMLGDGNVSRTQLDHVLKELENQGYTVCEIKVEQITNPGQHTTMRVLAPPGTTREEVSANRTDIQLISDEERGDKNVTAFAVERPSSLDSKRIFVRYAEDGGKDKDGFIEIRPGVDDLYLGDNCRYSQVRINVDDKYYIKGMAAYGVDIPEGYDIIVNSNKHRGAPLEKVLKPLKKVDPKDDASPVDWDNPFGALLLPGEEGQAHYKDPKTGEMKLSLINKVNTEGKWDNWKTDISAQFLSKQPIKLIKQQLNLSYDKKVAELDEILNIANPKIRSYMLEEFSRDCDNTAVHLNAVGFPRQGTKVILPCTSLKQGEVYAPSYNDGEELILVRYPHSGMHEIPVVRVNNNNKDGIAILRNSQDAILIRPETAATLSGADNDGDTVIAIPIRGIEKDIKTERDVIGAKKAIEDLRNFDGKELYSKPKYDANGNKVEETGKETTGIRFRKPKQMGSITNLITDMTMMGAPTEEIIRATKHSMVVIDALKHNLDWRQSEIDNDIASLRKKYQGKASGGARTIFSRSRAEVRVDERALDYKIDPETGKIIWRYTGKMIKNPKGKYERVIGEDGKVTYQKATKNTDPSNRFDKATTRTTRMAETDDARTLMSNPEAGYPQEEIYAEYANKLKALGNKARKATVGLKGEYSEAAAKVYAQEVASLKSKLNKAIKNKPYEHIAQIHARATYIQKVRGIDTNDDPDEIKKTKSKMKQQALNAARKRFGAGRENINITDKEWEAMMAGALRPTVVDEILKNTTSKTIKSLATPRQKSEITNGMRLAITNMNNANPPYPLSEIASQLGLSTSTVSKVIRGIE